MVVVVDTNVIMDAMFDQQNHEDCWHIMKLIRLGEIKPLMCQGLKKEYFFIPSRISLNLLQKMFAADNLTVEAFVEADKMIYNCINSLVATIEPNCINVDVTSTLKVCVRDPEDDKLVNLAKDGNSDIIITQDINHFLSVESQRIKNNNGQLIKVMTPEKFLNVYTLQQRYKVRY